MNDSSNRRAPKSDNAQLGFDAILKDAKHEVEKPKIRRTAAPAKSHNEQSGFDKILRDAEHAVEDAKFAKATAHLPSTMEEGIVYYRQLIERHHEAMLRADVEQTMRLREEAHNLAYKLNGGDGAILAGPEAPGCVLEKATAAPEGKVPLWGQTGDYIIQASGGMRVRIEQDGIFGIGAMYVGYWTSFATHIVDRDRPFLSETGYRSFMDVYAEPVPNLTPDQFAIKVIDAHVAKDLKGKLVKLDRKRDAPARPTIKATNASGRDEATMTTEDERGFVAHWSMFGTYGVVQKLGSKGGKWSVGYGTCQHPEVFKTKREAGDAADKLACAIGRRKYEGDNKGGNEIAASSEIDTVQINSDHVPSKKPQNQRGGVRTSTRPALG